MDEKPGKDQELPTTLHKDVCAEVFIGYKELKALRGKNLSLLANEVPADDNVKNKTKKASLPSERLVDSVVTAWRLT